MVGEVKEHHRFLLLQQMALIEILEKQIAQFDQKIAERIEQDEEEKEMNQPPSSQKQSEAPIEASSSSVVHQGLEGYAKALARLDGIAGVKRRVAEIVLAEIGITMEQFPSDGHLASWAGMCPGSKVSAGKR
jgi:transposase